MSDKFLHGITGRHFGNWWVSIKTPDGRWGFIATYGEQSHGPVEFALWLGRWGLWGTCLWWRTKTIWHLLYRQRSKMEPRKPDTKPLYVPKVGNNP